MQNIVKKATMKAIQDDMYSKNAKTLFFGMDLGPPLCFRLSSLRRGASHHFRAIKGDTSKQKLKRKTNFPRPPVGTIERALFWNNLFMRQKQNETYGSREIFK